MEQMMTEESSGIQPKGDRISVEHSYALPGNSIQVENTGEAAVTENAGESTVTENGNVVVGEGSRERSMAILIHQQDVLIKTLQKQCYELLKKFSPSQRLAGDDSQTWYYTGLPSFKVFEYLVKNLHLSLQLTCAMVCLQLINC